MKKSSNFKITNNKLHEFIDKFTFSKILLIWLSIILLFGVVYTFLSGPAGYLLETKTATSVTAFSEGIYFSFITATTTGFGDIIPMGLFRFVAIIEVIMGLLLLAVVTSKLVSLKQNTIIEELYEITLAERINRVRARLLYLRQNMNSFIHKLEDGDIQSRDLKSVYTFFQQIKDGSDETTQILTTSSKKGFLRTIEPVQAGLIANSTIDTLSRTEELVQALTASELKWMTEKNTQKLIRGLKSSEKIFIALNKGSLLEKKRIIELQKEQKKIQEKINYLLKK